MAFEFVKKEEWDRFINSQTFENGTTAPTYESLIKGDLPSRSTMRSAGYDFRIPYDLKVEANKLYIVGTGVKWNSEDTKLNRKRDVISRDGFTALCMEHNPIRTEQVFLALYPRSSYGFKYGFHLLNTTGIIDADYYSNPENDGHILVGFSTIKDMELKAGDKFCQGIITPYFICLNEDEPTSVRTGGTGSTGK